MATRVVNIDPTHSEREIAETGDVVAFGEEVELEKELAERLLEQDTVWARPTRKEAQKAEGKSRRRSRKPNDVPAEDAPASDEPETPVDEVEPEQTENEESDDV